MARNDILSYRVLLFERDAAGNFKEPGAYPEPALATVTTHDLPPSLGYLAGDHVRLRDQLGILTEPLSDELAAAAREQADWLGKLVADGVLDEAKRDDPVEVMLALHRFLLRTPSKVLLANLTDAVGERRAQNQPGTIDEYPNWRVPLTDADGAPVHLEDVFTSERAAALAEIARG